MRAGSAFFALLVTLVGTGFLLSDYIHVRRELVESQSLVAKLETELKALQDENQSIQAQNEQLRERVGQLENQVGNLQNEISVLASRYSRVETENKFLRSSAPMLARLVRMFSPGVTLAVILPLPVLAGLTLARRRIQKASFLQSRR